VKNLQYKKAVTRIEGTTDAGDYIEVTPGRKLVIELHREGQEMQEIPLAEVLELGLRAYLLKGEHGHAARHNTNGVRQ
jgi:hypothetical protein